MRFMGTWGVDHRRSSAYLPQSNGRAEDGVKSMKRILTENISESGRLDRYAVLMAILAYAFFPKDLIY